MSIIGRLTDNILKGGSISREEALQLSTQPLEDLCSAADLIRRSFCGNTFDLCTIINAKSGRCSENCKFCAQSSFYQTSTECWPLLSTAEIVRQAEYNDKRGVLRYSLVTSGRRLTSGEVDQVCDCVRAIKASCKLSVCVSLGLLKEDEYRKLADAGVSRVHNNLETSRSYFPEVCTTHSFEDKITAIRAAQSAGLAVCSGGIMGLGESMEDRIDLAITLKSLGIRSVPVNLLNPIPGTPFEDSKRLTHDDLRRITAIFRFLLPDAFIRLAGGRGLLSDKGRSCFLSGANAAITGDMLTTSGISIEQDMEILSESGYCTDSTNM